MRLPKSGRNQGRMLLLLLFRKMMIRTRSEPFFLPLTSLMVLKPIKNVLAFNFTVLSKPSRDSLNLISAWGPNAIVVIKLLQDSNLVGCGSPPRAALPAQEPRLAFPIAAFLVALFGLHFQKRKSFYEWISLEMKWVRME